MKKAVLKIIKVSSIVFITLIVLGAGGLALLRYFFSEEKIKDIIVNEAANLMHHKIEIDDLRYGFGGVIITGILIYDGTDDDSPVLLKASSIDLGFSLFDLIKQKLNIKDITITDLELTTVIDANNDSNIKKLFKNMKKTEGKSTISTNVSRIRLKNAHLFLVAQKGVYAPLAGEYVISTEINMLQKGKMQFEDCYLKLPDTRGDMLPNIFITRENGSTIISGDVGLQNTSLLWVYKWMARPSEMVPYNVVNGIVKNFKIEITPTGNVIIEGNVRITSTILNHPYILRANGFCRVDIKGRSILIYDINAQIDSSSVVLNKLLLDFRGNLISFDAKNAAANIMHLRSLIPLIPSKISGYVSGDLSYASGQFTGALALQNAGFDVQSGLLTGVNGKISINANRVRETGIPIILMGNPCTASLATIDNNLKNLFIDIKGEKFIIKGSSEKGQGKETSAATQMLLGTEKSQVPLVINGRLDFGTIQYNKLTFGDTSINYSLTGNTLSIQRLTTKFLKGTINGDGRVLLKEKNSEAALRVNFYSIALQDFSSLLPNFEGRMYGSLSGKGNVGFLLSRNFLNTVRGSTAFQIDHGKIVNTGIQNGLGIWLSELKYKLTDLEFNAITGEVDVAGKNLMINKFLFNSEDIRIRLQGKLNDDLEADNMNISLEFTPRFIQDVPTIALGLQHRKNDNWYTIPFIANGKITDGKNIKMVK